MLTYCIGLCKGRMLVKTSIKHRNFLLSFFLLRVNVCLLCLCSRLLLPRHSLLILLNAFNPCFLHRVYVSIDDSEDEQEEDVGESGHSDRYD